MWMGFIAPFALLPFNMILFMFQNVLFYALSDDIRSAKKKLLIKENEKFDIVFPGDGDIGSPGMQN